MKTSSPAQTKLTRTQFEQGGLLRWAANEAERLSNLRTFKPRGWTAVGYSRAYKGLMDQLRAVECPTNWARTVVEDIIDMARLQAAARHDAELNTEAR